MARDKNQMPLAIVAVAALLLVGFFASGGPATYFKSTPASTLSIGGTGGTPASLNNSVPVGQFCPTAGPVGAITAYYLNLSTTTGIPAYNSINVPVNVLYGGGQAAYEQGNTVTTGVPLNTARTYSCGQSATVVYGNDALAWENQTTKVFAYAPATNFRGVVKLASAPTLYFNNNTGKGWKVYGGQVHGVSNGQVLSGGQYIAGQIAAGQGWDGDQGTLLVFSGNTVIVTSVPSVQTSAGATLQSYTGTLPIPSGGYQNNGNSQWAFIAPALNNYQILTYYPTIILGTVNSNTATMMTSQNSLGVYLFSQANYYYNGQGSLLYGQFVNPGTTTPINMIASNTVAIGFNGPSAA